MPPSSFPSPHSDRIRDLSSSVFNYWFGYVSNIALVLWLTSRAFDGVHLQMGLAAFVMLAVGGLVTWTLGEYAMHKFLYHALESPLKIGHDLHHAEPHSLLGVPWWITLVAVVGLFYGFAAFFNPGRTGVLMAFIWIGYIGYCFIHHSLHHFHWRNQWFVGLRRHHLLHHAKHDVNWGVTTDLWDRVFRTKR
jgi:hypothetical protein